jgi:hypothetical protein
MWILIRVQKKCSGSFRFGSAILDSGTNYCTGTDISGFNPQGHEKIEAALLTLRSLICFQQCYLVLNSLPIINAFDRAFGDFKFKWDRETIESTFGAILGDNACPPHYKVKWSYYQLKSCVFKGAKL